MRQGWTCSYCGEVIGVYEPAIIVEAEGEERLTSRAAEPEPQSVGRYHEACRVRAKVDAT